MTIIDIAEVQVSPLERVDFGARTPSLAISTPKERERGLNLYDGKWQGKRLCDLAIREAWKEAYRASGFTLEGSAAWEKVLKSRLMSSFEFSVPYPENLALFEEGYITRIFTSAALGFARNRFISEQITSATSLFESDFQLLACDALHRTYNKFDPERSQRSTAFLSYLSRAVNSLISNYLNGERKLIRLGDAEKDLESFSFKRSDLTQSSYNPDSLYCRVVSEGRAKLVDNLRSTLAEVADQNQHSAVGVEMLLLFVGLDSDLQPQQKVGYSELARLFSCAENTVGTKIFRAKQALRDALSKRYSAEEWLYLVSLPELQALAA